MTADLAENLALPVLRDVIFTFSLETWSDARRRGMARPPDRLAQTFLRDPGVRRLLIANPYRRVQAVGRAATLRDGSLREFAFAPRPGAVVRTPLSPSGTDPHDLAALTARYHNYDKWLERRARRLGMDRPSVVTFNPFVAGFCELKWAGPVAYYARDDWAAYPPRQAWWPRYREAYAEIARRQRIVVAVSQPILDRLNPQGPAAVIANGIDPDEWTTPANEPPWLAVLPRPRLLYTGSLDDRLDPELLRHLSAAFADGAVVLLGPLLDPEHLRSVLALPNVHVRHAESRTELVGTVTHVDVCVLPHRHTELTEAMSPLKLYEYVGGGRRVVSTPLPGSREVADSVAFAKGGAEFIDEVRRALAAGPVAEPNRLAFVAANSWRERHRTLYELLAAERAKQSA